MNKKKKSNTAYYNWLDKIAAKKAGDLTVAPLRSLDEDLVYALMLNDPTYSYLVFYENNPLAANLMLYANQAAHFNDSGKTMYHPTFSDESLFSGYINEYNPLGIRGGHWNAEGTEYTPSIDLLLNYFNYARTDDYLNNAESHPVKIVMPEYNKGRNAENTWYRFAEEVGPMLYKMIKDRGIENDEIFFNHALHQLAGESQYGNSIASKYNNNLGGVRGKGRGGYREYANKEAFIKAWLDIMQSNYPHAINAKNSQEYVEALSKARRGGSYFDVTNAAEAKKRYRSYIDNAKTFDKNLNKLRVDKPELFKWTPPAGFIDGNIVVPVLNERGKLLKTLSTPIVPAIDIQTMMNPYIKYPLQPTVYPEVSQADVTETVMQHNRGKDGIHINSANRGKFNATKKRTGKTTEELTHSKNPLTRKRAIFALNARKWKH